MDAEDATTGSVVGKGKRRIEQNWTECNVSRLSRSTRSAVEYSAQDVKSKVAFSSHCFHKSEYVNGMSALTQARVDNSAAASIYVYIYISILLSVILNRQEITR